LRPPLTPAIGATVQQALWLYPGACSIAANQTFKGTVYRFVRGEDKVHLVFSNDQLLEVVFDTRWSSQTAKATAKKVNYLLDAYGGADEYDVILDNGFGLTMHRRDKCLYAQYSYACDVLSVGVMSDGEIQTLDWELRDAVP
jgi:hypothetical protein